MNHSALHGRTPMSNLERTSAGRRIFAALSLATLGIAALSPSAARADDSTSVSPAPAASASASGSASTSAPARHATLPAASPDGKLVAYCSERDGVTDIFVVDVGMGISRRVT